MLLPSPRPKERDFMGPRPKEALGPRRFSRFMSKDWLKRVKDGANSMSFSVSLVGRRGLGCGCQ